MGTRDSNVKKLPCGLRARSCNSEPRLAGISLILQALTDAERRFDGSMGALDTVSLTILLGAALVLAGILSSLIALRFGAPLLLVFLLVGMAAGDAGLGIKFDDVRATLSLIHI